jgi:hypothetical protein
MFIQSFVMMFVTNYQHVGSDFIYISKNTKDQLNSNCFAFDMFEVCCQRHAVLRCLKIM